MMKDAELDEIEARAAACFVGSWRAETWQVKCPGEACPEEMCSDPEDGPCGDDHTLETVTAPEEYPRDPEAPQVVAQVDESGIQTPGLGRFARAHAVFIAHARTDVPALVAEVRRLRAENERGVSMKTMTSCPRCGAYPFQHFLRWQMVRAFCWRRLIRKIWAILTNRLEECPREVGDFAVICRGCKNIVGYED